MFIESVYTLFFVPARFFDIDLAVLQVSGFDPIFLKFVNRDTKNLCARRKQGSYKKTILDEFILNARLPGPITSRRAQQYRCFFH
jgi:hypothetical protein